MPGKTGHRHTDGLGPKVALPPRQEDAVADTVEEEGAVDLPRRVEGQVREVEVDTGRVLGVGVLVPSETTGVPGVIKKLGLTHWDTVTPPTPTLPQAQQRKGGTSRDLTSRREKDDVVLDVRGESGRTREKSGDSSKEPDGGREGCSTCIRRIYDLVGRRVPSSDTPHSLYLRSQRKEE